MKHQLEIKFKPSSSLVGKQTVAHYFFLVLKNRNVINKKQSTGGKIPRLDG